MAVAGRLAGAPQGATWWRGQDLVAVARAATLDAPLPELDEEAGELRLAALVMAVDGQSIQTTVERLRTYDRKVAGWREEAGVGGD